MAYEEYLKAQKSGQKAFKRSIAKGQYPYLPVLDDILSLADTECEINLGIMDIRLHQVIGTSTAGRTNAFASNFMPLLEYGSEFATKWSALQDAQVEEGIRDAIKVYEYLNKYYVIEGNKRVSVLKYLDSPTIVAEVIRKVPKKSDDLEIQIYYEFMDFYELTKIHYLQFSKLGNYKKLLKAVGKDDIQPWTDEERLDFSSFHSVFYKAYKEKGGLKLDGITCGDALLFYLSLYSYQEAKELTMAQIKKHLDKIWPEIVLLTEADTVELVMDPKKGTNVVKSVINKIIPAKKKIAFVYDKEPSASDWIYSHELGRLHLDSVLGDAVETKAFQVTDVEDAAEELLEQICQEKYDIVFTVTPQLIKSSLKVATTYPQVKFLNCAPNSPHNMVRTYYTRMYEAKFLTGMIAGAMCENNKIGYIADYPIYGMTANINAFALGAKMVNPYAKVYLSWSTVKQSDAERLFWEEQINYISAQDMIAPQEDSKNFGLYAIHDGEKNNLAMSIYNWGVFYERLVNSIIQGTMSTEASSKESKAMNYWWGLSAGVIDVICSQRIPAETKKLIHLIKKSIKHGVFHPFVGPITDQNGVERISDTDIIHPEDILTMNWLAENVIGSIPTLEELKDSAKPVVELRGLDTVTPEQKGTSLL